MADTNERYDRQRYIERCFEVLKHVTTLSTAAALLILAIYREEPFKTRLLVLTLILIGACVVLSVFGMLVIAMSSSKPPPYDIAMSEGVEDTMIRLITIFAAGTFMAAVISFSLIVLAIPFWPAIGLLLALTGLLAGGLTIARRWRKRRPGTDEPLKPNQGGE